MQESVKVVLPHTKLAQKRRAAQTSSKHLIQERRFKEVTDMVLVFNFDNTTGVQKPRPTLRIYERSN